MGHGRQFRAFIGREKELDLVHTIGLGLYSWLEINPETSIGHAECRDHGNQSLGDLFRRYFALAAQDSRLPCQLIVRDFQLFADLLDLLVERVDRFQLCTVIIADGEQFLDVFGVMLLLKRIDRIQSLVDPIQSLGIKFYVLFGGIGLRRQIVQVDISRTEPLGHLTGFRVIFFQAFGRAQSLFNQSGASLFLAVEQLVDPIEGGFDLLCVRQGLLFLLKFLLLIFPQVGLFQLIELETDIILLLL